MQSTTERHRAIPQSRLATFRTRACRSYSAILPLILIAALFGCLRRPEDRVPLTIWSAPKGVEEQGFKRLIAFLKEKFPNSRSEIKRVIAEGDIVVLHVHSVREPGQRGRAIVDMFRLENGKIVEHWDVKQDIPDRTANKNGMF